MVEAGRLRTQHKALPSKPRTSPQNARTALQTPTEAGHVVHGASWDPEDTTEHHQASHAHPSQNACTRSRHSLPDPNTSREVHGASREPQDATYSTSKTPQSYKLEPVHCELRQKHACARRMYCKRILVEQMFVVRLHLKDDKAIKEHKQNADQNDGPQCNFVWRERMG